MSNVNRVITLPSPSPEKLYVDLPNPKAKGFLEYGAERRERAKKRKEKILKTLHKVLKLSLTQDNPSYPDLFTVAKTLKIQYSQVKYYLEHDPEFKKNIEKIEDMWLDRLEITVHNTSSKSGTAAAWLALEILRVKRKDKWAQKLDRNVHFTQINLVSNVRSKAISQARQLERDLLSTGQQIAGDIQDVENSDNIETGSTESMQESQEMSAPSDSDRSGEGMLPDPHTSPASGVSPHTTDHPILKSGERECFLGITEPSILLDISVGVAEKSGEI